MQFLSYLGGVVKVEETDLKPRMGFLYPINTRNISVFINATREQDSGQYMCTVNVVNEMLDKNVGIINLTVLGKALRVPPAPSDPPVVSLGSDSGSCSAAGCSHLSPARQRRRGGQRHLELLLQEGETLAHVPMAA